MWNSQHYMLNELKDHYLEITGLKMVSLGADRNGKFLLSCSMDANVRTWNLEDGSCLYRINTGDPVLGMEWMKNGSFCTFSKLQISIWELSRFFTTFFTIGSPLQRLKRVKIGEAPSRILGVGTNGSITIASPRTGEKLIVADPFASEMQVLDAVYDSYQGVIYSLISNGSIIVYDAAFSPCVIRDQWEYSSFEEKVICFAGLPANGEQVQNMSYEHSKLYFILLLCGTDSGQIVSRNPVDDGHQEFLIQAHSGSITSISINDSGTILTTASVDKTTKIWEIKYNVTDGTKHFSHIKDLKGRSVSIDLQLPSIISTGQTTPDFLKVDEEGRFIGVASRDTRIQMNRREDSGFFELPHHPRDEDHTKTITSLTYCPRLGFLASGSADGTTKIWNCRNNALLMELQFHEMIDAVEFANERGDLLVALNSQVTLVKFQDYIPQRYLRQMFEMEWEDDYLETPDYFDPNSEFWLMNLHKKCVAFKPMFLSAQQ
jgi:WD40 repeat protein